jgi:hypothetical protein
VHSVEHPEGLPLKVGDVEGLEAVARRLVWWETPQAALQDRTRFIAQVMALGTDRDVETISALFGETIFDEVLDQPPAGLFTARRWNYWHVRRRRQPTPPLPRRFAA